ncbi:MAG: tRNA lysidine(34) synthetase TilS [Lachnospiraceae bacterium]|jgi:tRNA(Ile)-lysidine synthase|nr:tRNA lysidine(34) synthetase TilS [Lachnospiraceae bacterium]
MYSQVKDYISINQMIVAGDDIVAGISGGADSICLLFMLSKLQKEMPFRLRAVHINHMLRTVAKDDEAFVVEICASLGIPLRVFSAQVAELAKEQGKSIEEAGRDFRYQCFHEALSDTIAANQKIAVGHHMDDRAETLLFNLFRGSGLRGMTAIRPVRDNIIRPLLFCRRHEIENWLTTEGIKFRTDETNALAIHTRNRIRHHIMPHATEINSEAVRHMTTTADLLWEAENYLHHHTETAYHKCAVESAKKVDVDIPALFEHDLIIRKRVLIMAVERLSYSLSLSCYLSARCIDALLQLTTANGSKQLHLDKQITARREYDTLVIMHGESPSPTPSLTFPCFSPAEPSDLSPQQISIPGFGMFHVRIFARHEKDDIPQKKYTKWFDCDKISSCAMFRQRKPSDYLIINRFGQRKSLADYLIDEKVPRHLRDEIFVLADDSSIMWVPGLRISERYKITADTSMIMEVILQRE